MRAAPDRYRDDLRRAMKGGTDASIVARAERPEQVGEPPTRADPISVEQILLVVALLSIDRQARERVLDAARCRGTERLVKCLLDGILAIENSACDSFRPALASQLVVDSCREQIGEAVPHGVHRCDQRVCYGSVVTVERYVSETFKKRHV